MSDNALGVASLVLSTDSAPLEKGLAKSHQDITAFVSKVSDSFSVATTNPYIAMASAGLGALKGYWDSFSAKANEVFQEVSGHFKDAMKVGIGTNSFEKLLAGSRLDADALTHDLGRLQIGVGELAHGGIAATETFNRLGLSMQDLAGKDVGEQFNLVAEKIKALPTAYEQANAAQRVFGKEGLALLPAIRKGMDEATQKAIQFGQVVTDDEAQSVKKLTKTWGETTERIGGMWTQLSVKALPLFQASADAINDTWAFFQPFIMESISWMGKWFAFFKAGFEIVSETYQPIFNAIKAGWGSMGLSAEYFFQAGVLGLKVVAQALVNISNAWLDSGQVCITGFINPVLEGLRALFAQIWSVMDALPDAAKAAIPGFKSVQDGLANASLNAMKAKNEMEFFKKSLGDMKIPVSGVDEFFALIKQRMEKKNEIVKMKPEDVLPDMDEVAASLKQSKAMLFNSQESGNTIYQSANNENYGQADKQLNATKEGNQHGKRAADGIGQLIDILKGNPDLLVG
jgi:phage-related protein